MKLSRHHLLYGALISTVALVLYTSLSGEDSKVDPASARHLTKQLSPAQNSNDPLSRTASTSLALGRDPLIEASADPFMVVNFAPPLPSVSTVAIAPPPKPVAPPFPYHYFGSMTNIEGSKTFYLQRGEDLVAISAKQVLDRDYRVESVDDRQVVVLYLPLEEKTVLTIQTAETN